MAAYASLLSLTHILDQLLQHPARQRAVLDKAQIDSLLENITFLQEFLEIFSLIRGDEIQALEEKMARSAYAAEDIIESRVVDQILEDSETESESRVVDQTLEAENESSVVDQILPNSKAERRWRWWRGVFSCLDFANLFFKERALPNGSAAAAEDIIESSVVDQMLEDSAAGSESSSTLFSQDLQKVIEEFDSMKEDVMKIKATERIKIMEQPRNAATAGSLVRGASDSKNTMVGFDEDLIQIMEKLTGDESNLQILSVVGMGGMGKTTIAKNVFDNPLIVKHFDCHAWVTISQQYSVHEILVGLLKGIGVLAGGREEITDENDDELALHLYRSLFGRRYFIVMDDMWSIKVWDGIKRFFPDNSNGSRVLVTTRLSNVADNFQSCTPHQLHFLDEDNSWALFCDKVFGKESCPPELEEVGKTIVRNCRGLPLAIVAISGLLAKSSRKVEYWEYIANDTYAAINMGDDGLCFEILALSYKHLPVHLKPCFLYMAIFPEDHKIIISRLVKLWAAEGILKPIRNRSLEEIALDNLKDLIDRNLIQVHGYGSRNKIKTCTIHDLLRDLCLREAQKEKFLCVTMIHSLNSHPRSINNMRRLIIRRSSNKEECLQQVFDAMNLASCTRSLICCELEYRPIKLPVRFRLLRVLSIDGIYSREEILQLVNLRCIHFEAQLFRNLLNILESLSMLWNLQSVTFAGTRSVTPISLPAEIWEMPQLRHLKTVQGDFYLPDPPRTNSKNGRRDIFELKNLQTLYKMRNFRCTDDVVHRIPNLKKLGINYRRFPNFFGWDYFEVYNLGHLRNLESLFLSSVEKVPHNICFPRSLKKLSLESCGLCWEDLTVVGSLPQLEVLNLMSGSVEGREWNPVEGEFHKLKSLRIDDTDVEEWMADSSHFPSLEKLQLGSLWRLKEIPCGIGEIPTLRSISLVGCCDSANSSAEKIQEEQQKLDNHELQVRVSRWADVAREIYGKLG